ncbi:hypothetical protein ACQPWW_32250 [Micromonospora sp. CA-240977]|uniref:hypothetical protein n=1 Tax=Micromonospora sp. CA-240977 TaxID=3239957 RepID=UPI003D8CED3A
MRPAPTTAVTAVLLATLLSACTSVDRAVAPTGSPVTIAPRPADTATGTPLPTTAPTASPGATGVAPRVVLRTSGGFAGRGDAVTVEPDGQWTAVDRAGSWRSGKLDPADLGRLTGLAADPRLAAEARRPTSSTLCSDAISYQLTVGSAVTGYAACPADGTPPPATQALVKLLLRTTGTQTR